MIALRKESNSLSVVLANAAKGVSAMQLARDIDVQHKTAWVLCHKLREAMAAETKDHMLSGIHQQMIAGQRRV
jgi:hypothetical protein